MENYPPFPFEGEKPNALQMKHLIGTSKDATEYRSEDGRILINFDWAGDDYYFKLQADEQVLVEIEGFDYGYRAYGVYEADLNSDQLADLIVFSWAGGTGLAADNGQVDIFLQQKEGDYSSIQYESFAESERDFVDINGDGVFEVIVGSFYFGDARNYFTYSVYEIADNQLVNADAKYPGFPKFIRYTHQPNNKPASDIPEEKIQKHIAGVQSKIRNGKQARYKVAS
jgi:hypothetical protein